VIWGIVLQLILGLLILRTEPGKTTFSFLGKQVEHFQSPKITVLVSRAGK
jgi:nucleoside permease NupC